MLREERIEEAIGEHPDLLGVIVCNCVTGLQSGLVSATVNHVVAYLDPEQGLNTGLVHGGERGLRTTWLMFFRRHAIHAGALRIKCAYHSC